MNRKIKLARSRLWPGAAVLVIYTALTVVLTWPIAGRLGTHVPGVEGDVWSELWTLNWLKNSFFSGRSLIDTNLIFYPQGVSLLWHNVAWVNAIIWLPIQAIFGSGAAYSLLFLSILIFNGFAVFLLARDIFKSDLAAFVGGLVAAFYPYILAHHDHPNLIFIAWIPLALLYFKRALETKRLVYAIIAGVFAGMMGITFFHYLTMGGMLIGAFLIYQLVTRQVRFTTENSRLIVVTGVIALLILLPALGPMVYNQLVRANPEDIYAQQSEGANSDLLAYVVPSRYHPLWGEAAFEKFYGDFDVSKFFTPFIGYTTLALIIFGLVRSWRQARFWFIAAAMFLILALGPYLEINGREYLPLPYYIVEDFFVFRALRHPDRFNALLVIPVSILAANGAWSLLSLPKLKRRQSISLVIVGAGLISFEYAVRYPLLALDVSQWYEQLAQEEGDFAILDLPMHYRLHDEHYMYYQTVHGKPIVGGHISRPPRESFAFIRSVPMLAGFPDDKAAPGDLSNIGHQLKLLADKNIRYLILHKRLFGDDYLVQWQKWLKLEPLYEDDELAVYSTSYTVGRDLPLISMTSDGIGLISATLTPTATVQGGSISVSARWGSQAAINQDYDVCLAIQNSAGQVRQSQCRQLSPGWTTSNWTANEFVDETYTIAPNPFLPTGIYSITLGLYSQESNQAIGRSLPVDQIAFSARPRIFPPSGRPVEEIVAQWSDQIALLDYELVPGNDQNLTLAFRWQALRRMDNSYKLFVHLVDTSTEEIISQVDTVPDNWNYPTNWWEQGELVEDVVELSLVNVPTGAFVLRSGWYDPENGERLPVTASSVEILPGASIVLAAVNH